jgi:thiol-disulfide isomerase/thioredoxin
MDIACVVSILLYFLFVNYILYRTRSENKFLNFSIIVIGIVIVHVPVRLTNFNLQLVSFPEFICEVIGVILGYLFFYINSIIRYIFPIVAIVIAFCVFTQYKKVQNWINYSSLFYQPIKNIQINDINYLDTNKVIVNQKILVKDKIIVLYFWAISCNACKKQFTYIDSVCKNNINNQNVSFNTICILSDDESIKMPYRIMEKYKCDFPLYITPSWDLAAKILGIDGVPVTYIIKNNKVLFRGDFKEIVEDELKDYLK